MANLHIDETRASRNALDTGKERPVSGARRYRKIDTRVFLPPMHADHADVAKRTVAVCNALLAMTAFPEPAENAAKREAWTIGRADAMEGRPFPKAYDGWSRALQRDYENGRQWTLIALADVSIEGRAVGVRRPA